jgi:hypothetical protein
MERPMKHTLFATAVAFTLLGAGAAQASERCNVPMADWQPRTAVKQKLEQAGWKVQRIKADDGCYEVRGTDPKGRVVKAKVNPKTLALVRAEMNNGDDDD